MKEKDREARNKILKDRERERERETDRQRDRQRDTQRDTLHKLFVFENAGIDRR